MSVTQPWAPRDERTAIRMHAQSVDEDLRWLLARTRPHTQERALLDRTSANVRTDLGEDVATARRYRLTDGQCPRLLLCAQDEFLVTY